ncbi:MAG: radical SAM protein [Actinomycetota bacterium]|nr:MAG: radical SAM protein [Actinomycetota bacterium]
MASTTDDLRRVALVTLGCARNEVDSEELAARLEADGWLLVADADEADAVVVNTCGFVEAAKKDSVDTLLAAADRPNGRQRAVVAVGCLAERYGADLAAELPEADAVLGFDDYAEIGQRLRSIVAGVPHVAHVPTDRRRLLPLAPVERRDASVALPGHATGLDHRARHAPLTPAGTTPDGATPDGATPNGPTPNGAAPHNATASPDGTAAAHSGPASGPPVLRRRLDGGPVAPLKIASGCDRRCSFCAIPAFRGSFVSRRPTDILAEARWLAADGVRELILVSENSTSYGKDLGDLRLLETLLPELGALPGIDRVRVSYLQPAETRPSLVAAIAGTPGVAPYYDLSFQHASATVLRRMRRFGGTESFLALVEDIRSHDPAAGIRSNVIVGFPGETEDELAELEEFLVAARLDAVGVFGYSDEDGTEAATLPGRLSEQQVRDRVERVSSLVDELTAQRAEDRIGQDVLVLVEHVDGDTGEGRAAHQGPEDGRTTVTGLAGRPAGTLLPAVVVGAEGIDLLAEARELS